MPTIGIYKIQNKLDGRIYIGQSVHVERRLKEHLWNEKSDLDKDISNYGKENFTFEIIEECSKEELNIRERYWIKYYNCIEPKGYNKTAGNYSDIICSKDNNIPLKEIIEDLQNTELNFLEIANKYNLNISTISRINYGNTHYQDNINYPIRKRKEKQVKPKKIKIKIINKCSICGAEIKQGSVRCKKCANKVLLENMPITREELKNLIRTTSFVQIGALYKVSDNAIKKWCDKFNLPRKKSDIKKYSDEDWNKI